VTWKWLKGESTSVSDLGEPRTADGYALCLFDDSAGSGSLLLRAAAPAGDTCGSVPCWTGLGTNGFRYRDRERSPDGIARLVLKAGTPGKARALVKGDGPLLSDRPAGLPTLPLALPLRVQLHAASGACFQTAHSAAGVSQNDASRFRASAR
jgi:hypothetical protein